jgi:DNA-binding transcriptional MerR regulator
MPGVVRNAAGRRVFCEERVDWLDVIGRVQRTGMPLAEGRRCAVLVMQVARDSSIAARCAPPTANA